MWLRPIDAAFALFPIARCGFCHSMLSALCAIWLVFAFCYVKTVQKSVFPKSIFRNCFFPKSFFSKLGFSKTVFLELVFPKSIWFSKIGLSNIVFFLTVGLTLELTVGLTLAQWDMCRWVKQTPNILRVMPASFGWCKVYTHTPTDIHTPHLDIRMIMWLYNHINVGIFGKKHILSN